VADHQWVPVAELHDPDMVHHASVRGVVRTQWGADVTLVRWRGFAGSRDRKDARIELAPGVRRTVRLASITHVRVDNPTAVG